MGSVVKDFFKKNPHRFGKNRVLRYLIVEKGTMTRISNKDELRRMISRYVRGQASREEVIFLNQYFDHFDDKPDGIAEMSEIERAVLKEEMLQFVNNRIDSSPTTRYFSSRFPKVAAVLIVLVVAALFYWLPSFHLSIETNEIQKPGQVSRTVTYTFEAENEPLHHYLPDGSYVVLEPGTKITYQPGFQEEIREVELEGKAFFDIRHDADRPFVVKSNDLMTRVLGTAFYISTFDSNHEFSIAVTRGKVAVSDHNQDFGILEMNDQMVLNMDTYEVTRTTLKENEKAELEPLQYIMDDITVAKALDIIQLRWDCEFRVVNKGLYQCEFTTSFLPTDSLEEIVAVISAVIGAQYQIEGRKVTLTGTGCEG